LDRKETRGMFRGYETLIIAHPEVSEEEINGIVDKLKNAIINSKGDWLKVEKWGERKLVYKIKGLLKGYFLLVYFLGNPDTLKKIDTVLRYNERVLRYQTVKLNKKVDPETLRESDSHKKDSEMEKGVADKKQEVSKDEAFSEETKTELTV
jgi:small subunit ribosomal protein S6